MLPPWATAVLQRVSGAVPGTTWTFLPRESGPLPGRACQHPSRVTSVPGHPLHCPRHFFRNTPLLVNQNMLVTAFLKGKFFSKKNAYHAYENVFLSC